MNFLFLISFDLIQEVSIIILLTSLFYLILWCCHDVELELLIYLLFMLEHFVMDSDLVIAHALSFIWFVGLMGADLGPAFLIKLLVLCLVDF